ncbi:L-Proline/Glycine betaine transporter ProP [Rhodococcus wratislaviensis]|uniref:Putative proline/betaine transporter n=1 Tax=Rhodococcus wratislaviensis TaxID=44752 RepID=A0A402CLP3_RHOWR|nr:MFS transporter [Rhodococcus wratislaviensis]GCE44547.1 L-Proline/Glycine betaine transporter ProP [Rhodococcus wratislaviensis]
MSTPELSSTKSDALRRRRGVLAASVGTIVEYYDFTLYAYLAIVVSPLFFPGDDPTASLLASLAVFASAYLMRPIGGLFFGWLGDRGGRRRALLVSVLLMGIGSILMAFLPTYESVGVAAPILLVLARLAQGFSAGGEVGGALTYVYETVGPQKKGLGGSWVAFGTYSGFALAAVAVGAVSALTTPDQMDTWGWRLPFLLAVPLLLFCLWIRTRIEESSQFEELAEKNNVAKAPVRELLRDHCRPLFQVFGVGIALNAAGYMALTYIGIHLVREGGYDRTSVAWTTAFVVSLIAIALPAAGALVDKWGSTRVGVIGMIYSTVLAYPAMLFMEGNGLLVAGIAFFVLAMGVPLVQASAAPLFPALLASRVRLSGVALGFNLATILAGGTAAYVATWLIDVTGDSLSPAYFLIGASIIGLATMATLRGAGYEGVQTHSKSLQSSEHKVESF